MNANGFLHHMIYSPETGIILVLTLSAIIQTTNTLLMAL
jgi:hypothetical protein